MGEVGGLLAECLLGETKRTVRAVQMERQGDVGSPRGNAGEAQGAE